MIDSMNATGFDQPDRPLLPRQLADWICVFGPGAIIASLTIGTGELIFSTRGGALFGYHVLFVFAIISLLKWGLVVSMSRHMILTGVHPYERMIELPGPRGWLPITLLLMSTICVPIWISFHSGVLGNLMSWITGTRNHYGGGMDYLWGAGVLIGILILTALGGYSVLERLQLFVVTALVICATLSLLLYQPDWLQLLLGVVPQPLSYPSWLAEKHPEIAKESVFVETTRYVGVIGGAGFDYLAYVSWLREKRWGILPARATREQLNEIASNPRHDVRQWIKAPIIDCAISFALIMAFCAVFVALGATVLGPEQNVPNERNMLNLQSRFVTRIHPLLLPLYLSGAMLTMLGTLYGTVEVGCAIADEIMRSLCADWSSPFASRLRRIVIAWSGTIAISILGWLFIRQAALSDRLTIPERAETVQTNGARVNVSPEGGSGQSKPTQFVQQEKPRLLLAILTPVNLFTGVLSCGLICLVIIWADRRWLPDALRPPPWLTAMNAISAAVFLSLGLKGYWDNDERGFVFSSLSGVILLAMLLAAVIGPRRQTLRTNPPAEK